MEQMFCDGSGPSPSGAVIAHPSFLLIFYFPTSRTLLELVPVRWATSSEIMLNQIQVTCIGREHSNLKGLKGLTK